MKIYGETIFDICYLLIAIILGASILIKGKDKLSKLMGTATLILGFGDAFHLVPRILDYFVNSDFTVALGIGKLITSIMMTIFYVLMLYIYQESYQKESNSSILYTVYGLAVTRMILCLLPQNNWMTNDGSVMMGIIRNIPFVLLGLIIIILYFKERKSDKTFHNIWLYVLLSFLFYIPVVVGSSKVPVLGMLMLPKTICYIFMIVAFYKKSKA